MKMNNYIKLVNDKLDEYLQIEYPETIFKSMKYTLNLPGKRLRPVMCLEICRLLGGEIEDVMPTACAIEMLHVQTLIHDDMPCMDNDDMRRGKPSCHKQFGEANALLAGDALLTHAFEIIATSDLSPAKKTMAVTLLSQNAGVGGMIGGQVIDLIIEDGDPTLSELLTVYKLKTGALISAACLMGCISAGATEEQLTAASKFAYSLGVAFQIQDDILDIIGSEEELGKPIGSDAENNKKTYASVKGLEGAKRDVERLTAMAVSQLDKFENTEFLRNLAVSLINRNK